MPRPRQPVREETRSADGERVVVREVVHPGRWKHRDRLVAFDHRQQKDGAWVRAIDEVFDADWFLEQKDVAHAVARAMCWPYAGAIRNIADVADLVCATRTATAGADGILRRMRVPEEFLGASFEARVARLLVEAGLKFEFVRSTGDGKALDIRVYGAPPFTIEVKSRLRSFRSSVEEALTRLVSPYLVDTKLLGSRLVFDWYGAEVQAMPEAGALERLHTLAARAFPILRENLGDLPLREPRIVLLPGMGVVRVEPGVAEPDSIPLVTLSDPRREVDRLAKTIAQAAPQLDPERPGVVFLCVEADVLDKTAAPDAVVRFLSERGNEFRHVSGAVVLVVTSAHAMMEETWAVPNPRAHHSLEALPLPELRRPTRRARWMLDDPFAID